MAKDKPRGKAAGKPLSRRARALIESDPEAVAEILAHAKPDRSGVFMSKRSGRYLAVTGLNSGAAKPRGKAGVVKTAMRSFRFRRNAEVVDFATTPVSEPTPIPERLRRFVTAPADAGALISATEAARRLGVARGTVYAWIDAGVLLGWRQTGPGLFIPAEQIRGERDVVPGLAKIGAIIGDPRLLWSFLSRPQPFENEVRRSIELLDEGRIEDVAGAAMAFGSSPS
jgi:excisionase family DNA binding protein